MHTPCTILMILLLCNTAGFGQRTVSLDQAREYMQAINSSEDFDTDAYDDITYVKDMDGLLDQFVGIWKGNFDGKSYTIQFVKKLAFNITGDADAPKWDLILGIITVSGPGLNYSNKRSLRTGDLPTNFSGRYFLKNNHTYILTFVGRCYNEAGDVFITVDKHDPRKMTLSFAMGSDIQANDCPGGFDSLFPLSPKTMVLTKQAEPAGGKSPDRPKPTGNGGR